MAGSSPGTCTPLSVVCTLNEEKNCGDKQVPLFLLLNRGSLGSSAEAKGVHVQECLTVPWGRGGERGALLPGLLCTTWQSPISIISRQRHAPFAAHGATRQGANAGSSLAGF